MSNILTCSSFKEFIKQKHKFGGIEILLASYSILIPYGIGIIRFDMVLPILIGFFALRRKKHQLYVNYTPFLLLFGYTILHEILLCLFLDDIPSYHINATFVIILMLLPTFLITRTIDFDKFTNSLILISFIVVLGVFYHVVVIMSGGEVQPIKIPFMPFVEAGSRLVEEGPRPKSFFMEPSNVNNFLMFPLFLSLYYRKIKMAAFIILGILLTTSTNGIITTSVMIIVYLLTQKVGWKIWLSVLIMIPIFVGMYLTSSVFEKGKSKAETSNIEENVRTINGPILVMGMPKEHLIVGFPSPNVDDYKNKTDYIRSVYLITNKDGIAFVSGFWKILAKFGVVGMFIFLFAHYKLYRQCKGLILFFVPSFALMFSGGMMMDGGMFDWTIYILSFASYEKMRLIESGMTPNGNYQFN